MTDNMTSIARESKTADPGVTWREHLPIASVNVVTTLVLFAVCVHATSAELKLNDFYREAWPAYAALVHGEVLRFFQLGPAYAGSLVLRAPFALTPSIFGSHSARLTYFTSAVPCAMALAAFTTWLTVRLRERVGRSLSGRLGPFVACALNPVLLVAVLGGHPEEVLGAVLCVLAVVVAARGRAGWAAILIGLAIVNKAWAGLAVPVVLLALPPTRRGLVFLLAAALAAGAGVIVIAALSGSIRGSAVGAQIGTTFTVAQLLWWFGGHSWIANHARYVMLVVVVTSAFAWWLRRRSARPLPEALLLLSLVMLVRAALDPWNNLYYHVPFLLALAAHEVYVRKVPLLTLGYSYLLLMIVPVGGALDMPNDVHAAVYAGVAVPTMVWMASKLYGGRAVSRSQAHAEPSRAGVMKAQLSG